MADLHRIMWSGSDLEEQGKKTILLSNCPLRLCSSLVFPLASSLSIEFISQNSAPHVPIKLVKSEKDLEIVPKSICWFCYCIVVILDVTVGGS